jgi:antitoxin component YwqK of YwqJK toxin-antitoxin module
MKVRSYFLAFFLFAFVASSFAQVSIDEDGLYYDKDNKLYTGTYIEFHANGNKSIELNLKKGLEDGLVIIYFKNGEKNEIRSYKDGEMDGTWTTWNMG